jgi:hypothetical protein
MMTGKMKMVDEKWRLAQWKHRNCKPKIGYYQWQAETEVKQQHCWNWSAGLNKMTRNWVWMIVAVIGSRRHVSYYISMIMK